REIQVLTELVKGLSNKEIADVLCISTHTVISHRKNIVQKTGIKSQAGLTIYALSNSIISLDSIQ
ncbi:MAG TPA: helix-turn-helix transcriptional regulator, partial [Bacteroidales bacterium]|nr:helix-turn-helix transcriptional regulator [Bacteroidales bacterium]